jgi:hypothetical protein
MENTLVATAPTAESNLEIHYELKMADRCDRCGISSQAFAVAYKTIDGKQMEILLCGHHLHESEASLVAQGFSIQDDTFKINVRPTEPDPDTF